MRRCGTCTYSWKPPKTKGIRSRRLALPSPFAYKVVPVRIERIDQFGSPAEIAKRVVALERKKE
eukprot:8297-Eustigmatos_ZCMA.PRE.1